MQLTLLLPAARHIANSASFASWTTRGDRLGGATAGADAVLRECFEFIGKAMPTAALTRSLDATDANTAQWLRADPAFVMADAVTLRLLACGKMDLSIKEVEGFAATLKPLFGDAGFLLEAHHPERWYLRCSKDARLPKFSSPEDALGDDLSQHLPEGDDARRWRSLLNEVQMTLHDHPINVARARRGLPPVNNLWVWGGGMLPDWVRSKFTAVFSDDEVVVALARLADIACIESIADFDAALSVAEASAQAIATKVTNTDAALLIDLSRERDQSALERDWFAPINAALVHRKINAVDLKFASGERITIKPWHHWRFWRRAKRSFTRSNLA